MLENWIFTEVIQVNIEFLSTFAKHFSIELASMVTQCCTWSSKYTYFCCFEVHSCSQKGLLIIHNMIVMILSRAVQTLLEWFPRVSQNKKLKNLTRKVREKLVSAADIHAITIDGKMD